MIRAALLDWWEALAQFDVTPLNFEQFSLREIEKFMDAARRQAEEIKRANRA